MAKLLCLMVVSGLLLTACATTTVPSHETIAKSARDHFSVSGRFTVNYQKPDGSDDSVSGSFDWQQQGEQARIDLRSPLGQTLAQILVAEQAQLIVPDQPRIVAADVETLTQQQLGWRLPAEGLRDWLLGKPHLRQTAQQIMAQGKLQRLTQDGWQIDYLDWNGPLPRRLNLAWLAASPRLELRLVLDRWD
jgi:outer membrane lipoprotein LolB